MILGGRIASPGVRAGESKGGGVPRRRRWTHAGAPALPASDPDGAAPDAGAGVDGADGFAPEPPALSPELPPVLSPEPVLSSELPPVLSPEPVLSSEPPLASSPEPPPVL